ncbi:MAG: archease [Gammaproteobacteria bacterium]
MSHSTPHPQGRGGKPPAARWEHYHHGADIGVRGIGTTPAAAFEQAAVALAAVVTEPTQVRPTVRVDIECEAPDNELLLVDWLNGLVYEMAIRRMLFSRFDVVIDGAQLHGQGWGEPVDVDRHELAVEVKGATYTSVKVERGPDGLWVAQCVVDV